MKKNTQPNPIAEKVEKTPEQQVTFFDEKQSGLQKVVAETKVQSDEDLAKVSDIIKGIKTFKKRVEEEMEKNIAPAKQIIENEKAKYNPYLEVCKTAEAELKRKAQVYMEDKETKRLAAEQKIADDLASGKIKKEETAIAKLEKLPEQKTTIKSESSTLTMRKIKDIEIIKAEEVPDEYWVLDLVKIKKVALAGVEIPGVKVIEKSSMTSR